MELGKCEAMNRLILLILCWLMIGAPIQADFPPPPVTPTSTPSVTTPPMPAQPDSTPPTSTPSTASISTVSGTPQIISHLRLVKCENRPFHIEFRGYQEIEGVYQFQLYLSDVPSDQQPRLKKKGDPLGFENYTVGDFHLNIVNEKDKATGIVTPVDESTLDLLKTDIDFKVTLVFRKEVDAPESTADFVMLMPSQVGQEIKAPLAKPFSIPFIPNKQYRLVNVNDNGATIRDTDPANPQNIPVLKLDPSDWDEVPVPKSP